MSVAATLFQRFKQQKAIVERPARERYLEFVRLLADGGECELDELQMVCESLGIDEKKLQSDIDIQAKRFEAAEIIRRADDAAERLAKLEAEQQTLIRRKYEVCAPIDQRLNELHSEILMTRADATRRVYGVNYLVQNNLDVSITTAEHDIRSRRAALMPRLREVEAALSDSHDPTMAKIISSRQQVRYLESLRQLTKTQADDLRKARAVLSESEHVAIELENELSEIKRRFADLDDEQAALDKRKLNP